MARLTEEMVIARSKQSDLTAIKKLNCWGAELGDVSVVRKMPNVEVLALSINKIRTLEDFAWCRRLRELYIRKNDIQSLREIRHLRALPDLASLWLDENPCADYPEYRMTVLRNLPNLEKLDNVSVQPDEVQEAMRRGEYIPDSDDEGYPPQQESYGGGFRAARSADSSPEREETFYRQSDQRSSHSSEGETPAATPRPAQHQSPESSRPSPPPPAMTRSYYDARSDDTSLRHSMSTHSVKELSREPCPYSAQEHYNERLHDRCESYQSVSTPRECERERHSARERDGSREFSSAVMGERRGFTRRPVTRNSNLLSALLCLVKELDYPSLEVAEMAVRCRMDELANSQ